MGHSLKLVFEQPKHFLVHDDVVDLGVGQEFRVRVWRGKDQAPIVLVSALPDNMAPEYARAKLAQKVWTQVLRYTSRKPRYYEVAPDGKLRWIELTWIGNNESRSVIWKAWPHEVTWLELEAILDLSCECNPEASSVNFSVKGE
jgi:hypothetical protein